MSSATVLFYVAIGAFIFSAVFTVLAIVFFFRLDIRGVVNDLSGKTVARGVQSMKEAQQKSEKSRSDTQISRRMATSGKLTESKLTGRLRRQVARKQKDLPLEEQTTLLQPDRAEDMTTMLRTQPAEEATTLLGMQQAEEATTLLGMQPTEEATTILGMQPAEETTTLLSPQAGDEATTLLMPDRDKTTSLEEIGETTLLSDETNNRKRTFVVKGSVVVVHTDVVIK